MNARYGVNLVRPRENTLPWVDFDFGDPISHADIFIPLPFTNHELWLFWSSE